jgi:hypothetical protein
MSSAAGRGGSGPAACAPRPQLRYDFDMKQLICGEQMAEVLLWWSG